MLLLTHTVRIGHDPTNTRLDSRIANVGMDFRGCRGDETNDEKVVARQSIDYGFLLRIIYRRDLHSLGKL